MILMSFLRLMKRTLFDAFDLPTLITTFLFLYLINAVVSIPFLSAVASSLSVYLDTGSLGKSLLAFYQSLKDPVALLSFLLTVFLNVYLYVFVVSRIWQVRTGEKLNPFSKALERWIHGFVALLFISSLPSILFFLYILYQAEPISKLFYYLFLLSLLIWIPFTFPVLTSVIVEKGRGRDNVYEGLLCGKIYWWRILLGLIIISIFVYLLGLLLVPLYGVFPSILITILLYTFSTVWTLALSVEAYYGFKHGE